MKQISKVITVPRKISMFQEQNDSAMTDCIWSYFVLAAYLTFIITYFENWFIDLLVLTE